MANAAGLNASVLQQTGQTTLGAIAGALSGAVKEANQTLGVLLENKLAMERDQASIQAQQQARTDAAIQLAALERQDQLVRSNSFIEALGGKFDNESILSAAGQTGLITSGLLTTVLNQQGSAADQALRDERERSLIRDRDSRIEDRATRTADAKEAKKSLSRNRAMNQIRNLGADVIKIDKELIEATDKKRIQRLIIQRQRAISALKGESIRFNKEFADEGTQLPVDELDEIKKRVPTKGDGIGLVEIWVTKAVNAAKDVVGGIKDIVSSRTGN